MDSGYWICCVYCVTVAMMSALRVRWLQREGKKSDGGGKYIWGCSESLQVSDYCLCVLPLGPRIIRIGCGRSKWAYDWFTQVDSSLPPINTIRTEENQQWRLGTLWTAGRTVPCRAKREGGRKVQLSFRCKGAKKQRS